MGEFMWDVARTLCGSVDEDDEDDEDDKEGLILM